MSGRQPHALLLRGGVELRWKQHGAERTMIAGHVRKSGKSWCFVMDVGRDPDTNRRLQRWKSGFRTRKAAEEGLRKALHRLDEGMDPLPPTITLSEFVAQRLGSASSRQREGTPAHARRIRATPRARQLGPAAHRRCTSCARNANACARRPGRDGERRKAARIVSNAKAAMSSVFSVAVRWGLVTMNPVRASARAYRLGTGAHHSDPEQLCCSSRRRRRNEVGDPAPNLDDGRAPR